MEALERNAWRALIALERRDAHLFGLLRLPSDRNAQGRRYCGWKRYDRVHAARIVLAGRLSEAKRLCGVAP